LSCIHEHSAPRADDDKTITKWEATTLVVAITWLSEKMVWQSGAVMCPLFLGFILALSPVSSFGQANVTLAWNPSTNPIVAGYNIYYGGASGVYTNKINAGMNTSVTISNLTEGDTYYFTSTTYSETGAESALSSQISYTIAVQPVYQPPTLNPIGNVIINANNGAQTVGLNGISAGSGNGSQSLTVSAISSNPNLVSNPTVNYTGTNTSGTLILNPVPNASGSARITVTVNNGGASNNLASQSFIVTVGPVTEQIRRASGGQMVLTLSGSVGSNYVVQTSTDLVHWTPFSTNTIPPGGLIEIVDLNPASPQKFYRAAPFVLSAPPTPQQSDFTMSNGVFSFTLTGAPGNYVIQYSTNLVNWISFSTNIIPSSGSVQIIDPDPTSAQRFYRALPYIASVPQPAQLSGFQMKNGVASFVLSGPVGSNYVIQASIDLAHWTPFLTNAIPPDGSVGIADLNPASPQKFYRAASF
jgi:hypothetical protein